MTSASAWATAWIAVANASFDHCPAILSALRRWPGDIVGSPGRADAPFRAATAQLLSDVEGTIDETAVRTYYAGRIQAGGFDIADAAVAGNGGKAVSLARHALASGVAPVPIVAALAYKLRTLALVAAGAVAAWKMYAASPVPTRAPEGNALVRAARADLYQDAITWLQQILDTDPDNLDALLAIGSAEYQSSQYDAAEKHWRRVTELDSSVAEPWYNLGFLYMAKTPPETGRATECWNKVLEIAPDSDLAAGVRTHLNRISSSPTAAPAAPTGG